MGLRTALRTARRFPEWFRAQVADEDDPGLDPAARIRILEVYLRALNDRAYFMESWFRTADSLDVPLALMAAVDEEAARVGVGNCETMIALGPPDAIDVLIPDLERALFSDDDPLLDWPPPEVPPDAPRHLLMHVPRHEAASPMHWPVVLGHELFHVGEPVIRIVASLQLAEHFYGKVDPSAELGRADEFKKPFNRANNWFTELACDAYTVHRYGPAGLAAMHTFLAANNDLSRPTESTRRAL